ncbi:MAG: hypothetical protein LBM20_02305 [Rikenellaceae bacterium]|jgi:hypothetical protein|nr:hypothetical protein [Rikenellaceae bacterium]
MKRGLKWFIIIGGSIAAIVLILAIGAGVVRRMVERELAQMDLGDVRVTCESVRVDLVRQVVRLRGITLRTREREISADSLHESLVQYLDVTIEGITLRGITIGKIRKREFDFNALLVESPRATLVTRRLESDSLPERETTQSKLNRLGIKRVEVTRGSLDWRQITETDTLQYLVHELDVQSENLSVDSTHQARARFLYSDRVQGSVGGFSHTLARGDLLLSLDSLAWDSSTGRISVTRAALLPQHPKAQFTRRSATHADYIEARADSMEGYGVDFHSLWSGQGLQVDSLHVASGQLESYKNRQLKYPRKVKPMFHTVIQRLPISLNIKVLKVNHFNAAYEELAENGRAPGRITFDSLAASVYGLTNRVEREDQYVELYASGQVMNRGDFQAVVSMPVDSLNDHFEVKATLQSLPLSALNPMIVPLAQVEVSAGAISRMDFTLAGNSSSARMEMVMRYNGLEIAVMRMRRGRWQERGAISNLLNWAVIRQDNPDKNGLRTARTTVRRDPYRSAFNYLWKGISAGALETVETGTAKRLLKE